MTILVRLGLLGSLLVAAAWVIREREVRIQLEQALAQERRHADEISQLRSGNSALQAAITRLAEISHAREALRQAQESAQARDEQELPDGFIALRDLRNKGTGTVRDLFETYLTALVHLDTDTLARILVLPVELKRKLRTFLDSLPPEERAKYGSPPEVFATIYAAENGPTYYSGIKVVSPEPERADPNASFSKIEVNLAYSDGRIRNHGDWYAVPDGAEWKIFPANASLLLDKFLANK